jgi:hypothetical protein
VEVGVVHADRRLLGHEVVGEALPGLDGSWVIPATPSMALGRLMPWLCKSVAAGRSLVSLMRTWSPTATLMIGPGT